MKKTVIGIDVDYLMRNEYLGVGDGSLPEMKQGAKDDLKANITEFVKDMNAFKTKMEQGQSEFPKTFDMLFKKNWPHIAENINKIIKKAKTGEIFFDFKKFQEAYGAFYASDEATGVIQQSAILMEHSSEDDYNQEIEVDYILQPEFSKKKVNN